MKKLYAKTSFAHKKASKQSKITGTEPDPDEINRYPSPIMAYQQTSNNGSGGNFETATVTKTPKMSRAFRTQASEENDNKLEQNINGCRSLSPQTSLSSMSTNLSFYGDLNEPSHYYYSIGDVEHIPLLNAQQLNWQQQQRLRQQEWRRRRLTQTPVLTAPLTPFHQHSKMVLQLPLVVGGRVGDVTATKTDSPIYEQPQIVTTVNHMATTTPAVYTDAANGFASLPHDLNFSNGHRDDSNVGGCAASSKGEEAVSSINSIQQRLWQGNGNANNNGNNKHDKCFNTTTTTANTLIGAKTMLQHSQSMPMMRSKAKATTTSNQHNNFYQHNDGQQQPELQNKYNNSYQKAEQLRQVLQKQQQHQQPQEQYKERMTLPLERHNSVKENFISGLNNGVAAINMYVPLLFL